MKLRTTLVGLLAVVLLGGVATGADRIWTDSTGRFSIHGKLEGVENGTVDIRRDDGKLVRIPLEKLSDADRQYVRESQRGGDESPFAVMQEEDTHDSSL